MCPYSPPHAGELTSFNVAQECICECNGTSTGIFCRGANPMREFLAVASTEPGAQGWKMSKWFVGTGDNWRTTARFGSTCVLVFAPRLCVALPNVGTFLGYRPGGHHSTAGQMQDPSRAQGAVSIYRS